MCIACVDVAVCRKIWGMANQHHNDRWMEGAVKHPGALHRELGVPQGQKIPAKKLAAAASSSNPLERKRAALAKTFKRFGK